MKELTKKIVRWASEYSDAYGDHIRSLRHAIDSGNIKDAEVLEELEVVIQQWVQERNNQFNTV